ncbi:pfkB carbohydrate kinase family protein, partial [Vibrio parahaemolyticus 10296]
CWRRSSDLMPKR